MAKRTFALACAVSIALLALSEGRAQTARPFISADGCAILATTVFEQLTMSAWPSPGDRVLPPGESEVLICNQTARTVSSAFTMAMATMNVYISWRDPRDIRGDVCLSGDLSQCYPHRNPYVPITDSSELAFVYASWSAVQAATLRYAEAGGHSNTTRFSPALLKNELRRSMAKSSMLRSGYLRP